MTITKTDLTDSIHKGLGLPESRSSELLTSLFAIMKVTLGNGEDILRALKNAPFRPISALHLDFNPRNMQYIPVVKILIRLDLDQISADFEIEHFSKLSF